MINRENLNNPPNEYRPIPFWSWNDKLEETELRRQINLMNDAGIGGYFMHARGGLLTEYMGDEWFDMVKGCIDEGRKLGMNSWAYDENGWPSGFGSDMVNGLGLDYQQKYLRMENVTSDFVTTDNTISLIPVEGSDELYHLYYDVNPFYVDTLDGMITRTFLDKIYDEYAEVLKGDDWTDLQGFFTDEPQISRNGIPWSFIMEEEYEKEYSEALAPRLNELFMDTGDYKRTRYRFWRLVTILFMNNFMKEIYDWNEKHGTRVTGHHVMEESYGGQLTCNGAIMPQYQYYHIPGMDWLGKQIKPVTTPIQVASVAAQTGKKQILSETFALCGWNVSFVELKWMYQWQMVHGINLLCQHLESYTLKGIRKRDYPASLFIHQPWWKDYKVFNDYMSRVGMLLSEGEVKVKTLVLHGQSSAWLNFNGHVVDEIDSYFNSFESISDLLDSAHINYHYGDETIISSLGSVKGSEFVIGEQSYNLVIIPQVNNLSKDVYKNLIEFSQNGGKIVAVKNSVEDCSLAVDGEVIDTSDLTDSVTWYDSEESLAADFSKYTDVVPVVEAGTDYANINVLDKQLKEINFTSRSYDDFNGEKAVSYYFVNNDLDNGYDGEIYIPSSHVELFNGETGKLESLSYEVVENGVKVKHHFHKGGDLILIAKDSASSDAAQSADHKRVSSESLKSSANKIDLNGSYNIARMDNNLLTLDFCSYSVDGVQEDDNAYVLSVHDRLIKLEREVDLDMEFKFEVDDSFDTSNDMFLIIECPENFEIRVNGQGVSSSDVGYEFDTAFRKVDISEFVKHGSNVIGLKTRFAQSDSIYQVVKDSKIFESARNKLSYDMEIEAIYLSGDFGVKNSGSVEELPHNTYRTNGDFVLVPPPSEANLSEVHNAGLPFFAGSITLNKEFELSESELNGRFLSYDSQRTIVTSIKVNGKDIPPFIWEPFCCGLDGYLKAGKNVVEIELTNSLRNMLGPHHLQEGENFFVCPHSFFIEDGAFSWDKQEGVDWNRGYSFVEFGVKGLTII